ncbi:MAG: hypothetical protein AAB388_02715 [Patescibacteria group bacterium]
MALQILKICSTGASSHSPWTVAWSSFVVRLRSSKLTVGQVAQVCDSIEKRSLGEDEVREVQLKGRDESVFISRLAVNQIRSGYERIDTIPVDGLRIFVYE